MLWAETLITTMVIPFRSFSDLLLFQYEEISIGVNHFEVNQLKIK